MVEELKAVVFDGQTGQTTERELNQQELAALELSSQLAQQEQDAKEAKEAAKESALAKLAALGLTEEEIAAL